MKGIATATGNDAINRPRQIYYLMIGHYLVSNYGAKFEGFLEFREVLFFTTVPEGGSRMRGGLHASRAYFPDKLQLVKPEVQPEVQPKGFLRMEDGRNEGILKKLD